MPGVSKLKNVREVIDAISTWFVLTSSDGLRLDGQSTGSSTGGIANADAPARDCRYEGFACNPGFQCQSNDRDEYECLPANATYNDDVSTDPVSATNAPSNENDVSQGASMPAGSEGTAGTPTDPGLNQGGMSTASGNDTTEGRDDFEDMAGTMSVTMDSMEPIAGGEDNRPSPDDASVVVPREGYRAVAAGGYHTCGLRGDGRVTCWGRDDKSQSDAPVGQFVAVTAGYWHSCAIRNVGNDNVVCWGENDFEQAEGVDGELVSVTAGYFHTCGLRTDGQLTCWGLADGGRTNPPEGVFRQLSAGWYHTCAVDENDQISCWGMNSDGQLDAPAGDYTQVACGSGHSCALTVDGLVRCWGSNDFEQANPPQGEFISITAGAEHNCGLRPDGMAVCWGQNARTQSDAIAVALASVSGGLDHTCAVTADWGIACWGQNNHGQSAPPQ